MSFKEWLAEVSALLKSTLSARQIDELPIVDFTEYYDFGMSPSEVILEVVEPLAGSSR